MNIKELQNNKRKTAYIINVYLTLALLQNKLDLLESGLCNLLNNLNRDGLVSDEATLDTYHFLYNNTPSKLESIFIGNIRYAFKKNCGFYYPRGEVKPRKRLLQYYIVGLEIEAIKDKYIIFAPNIKKYKNKGTYVDSLYEARKYEFGDALRYKNEYPELEVQLV